MLPVTAPLAQPLPGEWIRTCARRLALRERDTPAEKIVAAAIRAYQRCGHLSPEQAAAPGRHWDGLEISR